MKESTRRKVRILWFYYRRHIKYNIGLGALSLLSTASMYAGPLLNAVIIDSAIGNGNQVLLLVSVAGYFLLGVFREALSYLVSVINLKYQYRVEKDVKNDLITYFLICNRTELNGISSGKITSIIRDDAGKFIRLLSGNMQNIILAVIQMFTAVFLVFRLQFFLGILVVVLQIVIVMLKRRFHARLAENSAEVRGTFISVAERLNEIAYHISEIPMIKADSYVLKRYNHAVDDSYMMGRKNNRIFQSMGIISTILDLLMTCLVLLVGGYFVIAHRMTVGILISFLSYSSMLSSPIYELCDIPAQYNSDRDSIETVFEILLKLNPLREVREEIKGDDVKVNKIQIKAVSFQYENGHVILEHTSTVFRRKGINYITGKSGIGKSTLIKLLMGLQPVCDGVIMFDNKNVQDIVDKGQMQYFVSWVPQEPVLFHDTVRGNLVLDANVPEEKLREACEKCAILEDISKMENGFDTILDEEGHNLSVGQKHRIGLARVMLQSGPVVIIDEPTAGVDMETENIIKKSIKDGFKNRIVIIITHSRDFIMEGACVYEIKDKKITRKKTKRFKEN